MGDTWAGVEASPISRPIEEALRRRIKANRPLRRRRPAEASLPSVARFERPQSPDWPAFTFPPRTREVQVDEKWGFVFQKEASCDPLDPLDRLRGDDWDHTAVDPESRLLLALVPGKRDGETCERLIRQVHDRTGGRTDLLITGDEHAPYETSIHEVYGVEQPRPGRPGPGRPPKAVKVIPAELCYATVRKRREKGHVVEVVRTVVFGTLCLLGDLLG